MYSLSVFYLFGHKSKKQHEIWYAGAGTTSFGVLRSQKTLKGSSSLPIFILTNIYKYNLNFLYKIFELFAFNNYGIYTICMQIDVYI